MIYLLVIPLALLGAVAICLAMGSLFRLLDDRCTDAIQKGDKEKQNIWCE